MLHPSYSELMSKINAENGSDDPLVKSRYSIVMGTAKRARQLVDKGYMELEDHSRKPLSIAVEELDEGDIRILSAEEDAAMRVEYEERLAAEEEERRALREARAAEAAEAARRNPMLDDDDDEDDEDDEEAEPGEEEAEAGEELPEPEEVKEEE